MKSIIEAHDELKKEQDKPAKKKRSDSSDSSVEEKPKDTREFKDWTKEEKEAFLEANRQKSKVILEDRKQLKQYEHKLKTETFQSFKDAPDEVKQVRIESATNNSISIVWKKPEGNGAPVLFYNIYRSVKVLKNMGTADFEEKVGH